jgi:hypothetical protein
MLDIVRRGLAPVLVGAGLACGLMACQGHGAAIQQHQITAQQSQMAKADTKALAAKCIPTGATQQIQVADSLKSKSGRTAFADKCGVPPQNKKQFEAAVLSAAEAGHLTTHAGRTTFFSVTLPKIIEENQG